MRAGQYELSIFSAILVNERLNLRKEVFSRVERCGAAGVRALPQPSLRPQGPFDTIRAKSQVDIH